MFIAGIQADTFYALLLARNSPGEFKGVVWDTSTQSVVAEFQKNFDSIPAGSTWTFLIQAPRGAIQFDNYREIQFNGEN